MTSSDEKFGKKAKHSDCVQDSVLDEALRSHLNSSESDVERFEDLMRQLRHVSAGGHFTRDEMNER